MGKERDVKRSRSSNEEGAEMRSLIYRWITMKGGGSVSGAATIYGLQVKGIWEGFKAMMCQ